MSRPDFAVTITGTCTFSRVDGSDLTTSSVASRYASETSSGVTRRKPKGFVPPTGYTLTYKNVDFPKGSCEYHGQTMYYSNGQKYSGIVGAGSGYEGRFSAENHFNLALTESGLFNDTYGLGNTALIAARNKIKDMKVDLGTAFGERKQLARMLGDTATNLARAMRALRRGETRKAMNALGISHKRREPRGSNIPKKWLELQYGWKPALGSVYGSADALSKRDSSDWRVTAKATRQMSSRHMAGVTPYQSSGFDACIVEATVWRSAFVRIDAVPHNELLHSLASVGVLNPLLVGWELVPFSFVVDWAWALGDWISSLDAMVGYTDAYISTSYLVRADWIDRGVSKEFPPYAYIRNHYTGTKKCVHLVRTASSGVPLPALPRLKDPRSLGHMANGLALLATVFGRGR